MVLLISIHEAARASTALNLEWLVLLKISIHEAARASTQRNIGGRRVMGISIHEAARASTLKKRMLCGLYGFQSTKPQGLRPGMAYPSTACKYFNPRSRKGFDSTDWPRPCKIQDFNPRSRKGFDRIQIIGFYAGILFQSTKPQGLRPWGESCYCGRWHFNPRSRKGFDAYKGWNLHPPKISIHEAARASTETICHLLLISTISIHEAARASTICIEYYGTIHIYFNPRSRKGFDNFTHNIVNTK